MLPTTILPAKNRQQPAQDWDCFLICNRSWSIKVSPSLVTETANFSANPSASTTVTLTYHPPCITALQPQLPSSSQLCSVPTSESCLPRLHFLKPRKSVHVIALIHSNVEATVQIPRPAAAPRATWPTWIWESSDRHFSSAGQSLSLWHISLSSREPNSPLTACAVVSCL